VSIFGASSAEIRAIAVVEGTLVIEQLEETGGDQAHPGVRCSGAFRGARAAVLELAALGAMRAARPPGRSSLARQGAVHGRLYSRSNRGTKTAVYAPRYERRSSFVGDDRVTIAPAPRSAFS